MISVRIAYVYLTEEGGVMKNKFLLIGLLFAVPLFFTLKANAQNGTSTLTQFKTIDCPPIEVSGKVAFEKDCVQGILNQVHHMINELTSEAEEQRQQHSASQDDDMFTQTLKANQRFFDEIEKALNAIKGGEDEINIPPIEIKIDPIKPPMHLGRH